MASEADKQRANELVVEAEQKFALSDYQGAMFLLDKAINLDPENHVALSNRGAIKNQLGQRGDAITDLDEAIRLKPNNYKAWNNRGLTKHSLGQYIDAVKDYDEAIRLNPDDFGFWQNRASTKQATGQHAEAIKDYDESIRLNPANHVALNNRGTAKASLRQLDEAIRDVEEALRLQPDHLPYVNNLAAIQAQKDAREAVEERVGSLARTEELEALAAQYKNEHETHKDELKEALNNLSRWIVVLVALLVFGFDLFYTHFLFFVIQFILFAVGWIDSAPNSTVPEFDWFSPLAFTPWFIMIALIVSPKVTAIRVLMQQANKAELMEAEYTHLSYVEKRMFFYFAKDDSAEGRQIKYDYIKATMGDSPSDKLLAMSKGKSSLSVSTPIGGVFRGSEKQGKK